MIPKYNSARISHIVASAPGTEDARSVALPLRLGARCSRRSKPFCLRAAVTADDTLMRASSVARAANCTSVLHVADKCTRNAASQRRVPSWTDDTEKFERGSRLARAVALPGMLVFFVTSILCSARRIDEREYLYFSVASLAAVSCGLVNMTALLAAARALLSPRRPIKCGRRSRSWLMSSNLCTGVEGDLTWRQ